MVETPALAQTISSPPRRSATSRTTAAVAAASVTSRPSAIAGLAEPGGDGLGSRPVEIGHRDRRARAREGPRDRPADAIAGAGHQRPAALERKICQHPSPGA